MRPETDRTLAELLRLPVAERGEVIAKLLASLEGEPESDVEAHWDIELGRRIAELDSGAVQPVPLAEARRRILSDD